MLSRAGTSIGNFSVKAEIPNFETNEVFPVDTNEVFVSERPTLSQDENEAFQPVFSEEIDKFFKELRRKKEFSGSVLIAQQGQIVHTGAYGYGNERTRQKLTTESAFQLASVSKTITATAILLLHQDGVLDIDDKVIYHIPEFPYEDLTIRHLLNHRSGLQRYMGLMHKSWDKRFFLKNEDVLDYYITHKPRLFFEPDSKFNYNNTNYVMLAAIVEYLTAKPFAEFLKERIFDPLGMNSTYLCNYIEQSEKDNHTIGYKRARRGYKPAGGDYLDGAFGDKGIYSTVMDMYRFDRGLNNPDFIKPELIALASTPNSPELENYNYGLGWRMKPFYPDLIYHFGWWKGYRTCFIKDLQADTTVIVLCNRDNEKNPFNFWYVYQYINGWVKIS